MLPPNTSGGNKMGFFSALIGLLGESDGTASAHKYDFVRVIEPSGGRIVDLEIIEKDEHTAGLMMTILENYAIGLKEKFGVKYAVEGKKIHLEFPNGDLAEAERQSWKKR